MSKEKRKLKMKLSDQREQYNFNNQDNPYVHFDNQDSQYQIQGINQYFYQRNQFQNQSSPNKSQQLSCSESFQSSMRQIQRNQLQQVNQNKKKLKKESKRKNKQDRQEQTQQINQSQIKKESKKDKQSSYTARNINYMVNYYPKILNKDQQLIRIQIQQILQINKDGNYFQEFVIISNRDPEIRQVILDKQQLLIFYNTLRQTYHKVGQLQPRHALPQSYNPSVKLIILYIFKNLFKYFKLYIKTFCKGNGKGKGKRIWNGKQMGQLSSLQLFCDDFSRDNKQKYNHQPLHIGGMYYLCCRFFRKLLIVLLKHKQQFKLSQRNRNIQQKKTKDIKLDHNFENRLMQFASKRIKKFYIKEKQQYQKVKTQIQGPLYFKVINRFIRYCQEEKMEKFDPKLSSIHHQIQKIRNKLGHGSKIGRSTILKYPNVNKKLDFKIAEIYMKGKLKNFKSVSQSNDKLTYNKQQQEILKQIKSSLEQQKFKQLVKKTKIQKADNPKDLFLLIQFNDEKQTKMNIFPTGKFIIRTKSLQEVNSKIRFLLIQVLRGRFSIDQQCYLNNQYEENIFYDQSKTIQIFIIDCQLGYELDFYRLTQIQGIRQRLSMLIGKQYLTYHHQTQMGSLVKVYLYQRGYLKFFDLKSQSEAKQVCDYIQNLYLNHQDMVDENNQQNKIIIQVQEQQNQTNQQKDKAPQIQHDRIKKKQNQQIKIFWLDNKIKQYSNQQLIQNQLNYMINNRQSDDQQQFQSFL